MCLGKIKTFPRVPGIDLYKSIGKNVVFEARINKVWKGSKMWLGFDGTYLKLATSTHGYQATTELHCAVATLLFADLSIVFKSTMSTCICHHLRIIKLLSMCIVGL